MSHSKVRVYYRNGSRGEFYVAKATDVVVRCFSDHLEIGKPRALIGYTLAGAEDTLERHPVIIRMEDVISMTTWKA